MAITSGYFNSVNGDRKYNADQMSEYFEGIINEGVCQHIGGGLAVTAGTGLTVSVATGKAFIGQKWIKNDAAMTLTITTAADQARIDAVVLRRNTTNRVCEIAVKTGTPSASPSAPAMTRTSTTYEMALAYVNVAAGATSVTVTDKRSDSSVCGWATVAQSTSGEVDQMLNDMKTGFDGVTYSSPAAMVQGCDTKLQGEINDHTGRIDSLKIKLKGYYPSFYVGSIDINTGIINSSTINRAYTDLISCVGCSIYVPTGWSIYLVYYTHSEAYVAKSDGWATGIITPNQTYDAFRMLIKSDMVNDFTGIANNGVIKIDDSNGSISDDIDAVNAILGINYCDIYVNSIDVTNGKIVSTSAVNRVITGFLSSGYNTIKANYGYSYYIICYDSSLAFLSSTGWKTGENAVPACDYYRLLIRNDNISDWTNVQNDFLTVYNSDDIIAIDGYTMTKTLIQGIDSTNYSAVLPDLNSAELNKRYRIVRIGTESSDTWPLNIPMSWKSMGTGIIVSIVETYASSDGIGKVQSLKNEFGYWMRHYSGGSWQGWKRIGGRNKIIIGAGGNYTSFSEGIIAAYNIGDCDVYVNKGEYNIKTEMEALFGSNFWTTDFHESTYEYGLPWGKGMRIIGSPGAVLKMDASAINNDYVWANFSILMNYMGAGHDQKENLVKGIKFDCTCIRYCIHLDTGAQEMDDTYIMDSCEFYLDNSDNTTKTFAYCIGMGASINTTFVIKDCYVYGITPPNPRDTAYLYFHHTNAADPHDKMIFEGNYIDNGGTIRIDAYGESENKCLVMVMNNSLGSALMPPMYPTDNLKVCAWNNEVRTS